MAEVVLILGYSGSGKSTSLRNFKEDEVGIINVANKRLPFKNKHQTIATSDYGKITQALKRNTKKRYVIDDSQYLLAFEEFRNAKQAGYGKYTDMAVNFHNLIQTAKSLSDDTIVYFLHHLEKDDSGDLKIKTIGKMLDQKLVIEGLFSVVLGSVQMDNRYLFMTNGLSPFKSPVGMFESRYIENDLKLVDKAVRAYWDIPDDSVEEAPEPSEEEEQMTFDFDELKGK